MRVVHMWDATLLDERTYKRGGIVVGYGPRADFPTASGLGLPPLFTLFRRRWKGWVAILAPGMTGELTVGGETRKIADILEAPEAKKKRKSGDWRAVAIAPGDWGVVRLRDHGFFFQLTPREELLPHREREPGYVRPSSAYSFTVHAIVVAITFLFSTWPPPGASTLGGYVIKISQQTPQPQAPPPEKKPVGNLEGDKKEKPAATADKEGKAGGEGKKPRATQSSPKPNPNAREELVKKVQDTGVLKYRSDFAKIAGPSQEDARLALAMARVGDRGYGSGHGTGVGPGTGTGTSTRGGSGAGGGGRSTSELITHGPIDTGTGRGGRGAPGGVHVAEAKVPPFKSEAVDSSGGLTPEQVRAVVERHRSALQWCFEKELQKNPKLSGKVVVFWQIEPSGSVSTSRIKSSTVGDGDVDDCLQRQVVKWTFPAASNGQITKVFYPFVFSAR
jgi:outer membrane biosynthesis protein TonB